MFFFMIGARPRFSNVDLPERRVHPCPVCCGDRTFERKRMRTWLELFFLPLLPLGSGREVFVCSSCGFVTEALQSTSRDAPVGVIEESETIHCLHCGAELQRPRHPGWRTLRCDHCGRSFEARI